MFFRSHEKHDFEKNVFKVGEQKVFDIYSTNGLTEIQNIENYHQIEQSAYSRVTNGRKLLSFILKAKFLIR